MGKGFEPKGIKFYDNASGRWMKLVSEGPYKGWLVYEHSAGQWVTLRQSTVEDRAAINHAVVIAHHTLDKQVLEITEGEPDDE